MYDIASLVEIKTNPHLNSTPSPPKNPLSDWLFDVLFVNKRHI